MDVVGINFSNTIELKKLKKPLAIQHYLKDSNKSDIFNYYKLDYLLCLLKLSCNIRVFLITMKLDFLQKKLLSVRNALLQICLPNCS